MPPTVTVLGHPDILGHDLDVDVSVPSERPSSSSDKEAGECLAQTKSSSSSDEEAGEGLAETKWIAEIADIISIMKPVRPDVVRATRVQNVLHRLGRPLRLGVFRSIAMLFPTSLCGVLTFYCLASAPPSSSSSFSSSSSSLMIILITHHTHHTLTDTHTLTTLTLTPTYSHPHIRTHHTHTHRHTHTHAHAHAHTHTHTHTPRHTHTLA